MRMRIMRHASADFMRDAHDQRLSLPKLVTVVTCSILSIAFVKNAARFNLDWTDYIGYSIGMAMSCSPALMTKFLGLKYGQGGNGIQTNEGGGKE